MLRALILAGLLVTSCTSHGVPTAAGVGVNATFLLANPAGLLALDENCRVLGRIVELATDSAAATPTLHPNGREIAFALTPPVPDPIRGFGSDIHAVDLAGGETRVLVEHEHENVFYASPRYDSTGELLFVHRRAARIEGGQYIGNDDTIERIHLATGQRTSVLSQAADHALSPDGKTIVYVRIENGQPVGIWIANSDGTNARPLFQRDAFWYVQAPRFAPSGEQIAFSAAGHTRTEGGRRSGLAHPGVPSDLFLAPLDGSGVTSIGQTNDDVVPAWSPNGERIAYVGAGALFMVNVAERSTQTCADGDLFFFGDLVWLR